MPRTRHLKETVLSALATSVSTDAALARLEPLPAAALTGPLLSALLSPVPLVRWRAVAALGRSVARLAEVRLEDGRNVVRRFMWSLNEESGAIGWGVPEAMAETLVHSGPLAVEFSRIYLSYIRDLDKDCTFIDHAPLRRGVYWGIARLAQVRPELVVPAVPDLLVGLSDCDPESRGCCALALERLAPPATPAMLAALTVLFSDPYRFDLFWDGVLSPTGVSDLAHRAYERLRHPEPAP
ncbi:MAG: HEAT repeat domain-containing protein [Desulfovibrionaceae bacterium]|nr:HEAT repeat domain-containing protein [Desulfovibrionaceae bacterium]